MREFETTLLAGDFVYLEAPRWFQGQLWVSDVFDSKLYRVSASGERKVVCEVPNRPSGIGFLPCGTPIVVSSTDRKLMKVVGGMLEVYADLSGVASGDLNDFVVDERGRIYVGNFGYDLFGGEPMRPTDIHVVEPTGETRIAASGLEFPNGAVLKDGGRTLVVAETWSCRLTAFDRDCHGNLSGHRVYADLAHRMPDGICVDAEGGIWVASFNTGEFVRVLDGGEITDCIACGDVRAVSCTLGGKDGRTLYCSTYAGTLEELLTRKRSGVLLTAHVDIPDITFSDEETGFPMQATIKVAS
jgi:sugar lactone lactonase YvrE